MISLILLLSPELKFKPLSMWPDWADTVSCIHIGHLLTQIVVFSTSWTPSLHLQFKIEIFHYFTACALNIMCLSTRQMAAIVLLSIVAQLPILFSTVNTIVSKSLCPCLWISNWIMWVITQVTCYFVIPGIFLIHPLVVNGFPAQGFSTPATITLFWAISYFGILFLWELHRPFKALCREFENNQLFNDSVNECVPVLHSERTPLVSAVHLVKVKNDISIP